MVTFLKKIILILIGDHQRSALEKDHPLRLLSDEELVEKIVSTNNTLLFGILYDRYADRIYTKCSGFARSDDEAEDLTQDVFLTLYLKLGSFRGISKFSSWVYSLTYNFCVNYVSRNKGRKISEQSEQLHGQDYLAIEAEDRSFFHMRSDKLRTALDRIPADDKTLLLLKYQDDVSVKDLAALLNLGESAVKMRLKRAKARTLATYNALP
jgi:RNA polymerase sigma-70 factor (ECF subfamily)